MVKATNPVILKLSQGALNTCWAATADKEKVQSGQVYSPIGEVALKTEFTHDKELAERLWAWTEKALEKYSA
jgi:hypothetical protein